MKIFLPALTSLLLIAAPSFAKTINQCQPITPLLSAIWYDNVALVEKLLNADADVNYFVCGEADLTPLMFAVSVSENLKIVQLLLDHGADPKVINGYGRSVLFSRITKNSVAVIDLLLAVGVDVNARDYDGDNALAYQVIPEAFIYLAEHGADVSNVNRRHQSLLHLAAGAGAVNMGDDIKIVEYLINRGLDVNALNAIGESPIHEAIIGWSNEKHKLVQLFIDYHANIDLQNRDGDTALMYSAADMNSQVVKVLVSAGANLEIKNKLGKTALYSTFIARQDEDESDYEKSIGILMSAGADISAQDLTDTTLLMRYAKLGNLDVVLRLLNMGSNKNLLDITGRTAAQLARDTGHEEVAKAIEDFTKIKQLRIF